MRVPSISSNRVRVAPQQERSARRLAAVLDAAAELFVEAGYDATTMQAIADRSGSSIGALYNYFPDKESVASTLRTRYSQDLRARLTSFMEHSAALSHTRFAEAFIECVSDFVRDCPAWLNLLAAPIHFRRDLTARRALRSMIADAFRARNSSLTPERALLAANVALQILKGMMALYLETEAKSREAVAAEFRSVLTPYLEAVLTETK